MAWLIANFDIGWLWSLAGLTMLHYLWAGLVLLLFAVAGRPWIHRAAPQIRYAYALGWLLLLAVLPIGIASWVAVQLRDRPTHAIAATPPGSIAEETDAGPVIERHVELPGVAPTAGPLAPHNGLPGEAGWPDVGAPEFAPREQSARSPSPGPAPPLAVRVENFCGAVAGFLPWLWLAGAPLTFALLATGLVGADRLSRQSRPLGDGPIAALCADLTRSLGIGRHVAVGLCKRIHSPILVGIIRPLILLPPAALTGWSPQQLEMVLLHELAHVRRWDNLVNLVQRLIESVLFFQPAVWIVSHWVRAEREHCCDAVVVLQTQRPTEYAQTLTALAAAHVSPSQLTRIAGEPVSAMAQRQLVQRIRNILDQEREPMQVSRKTLAGISIAVLLTVAVATLLPASAVPAGPDTNDRAAKVAAAEGEHDSSAADKSVLGLEKPPKREPQPAVSNDELGLRAAQLNYDLAKRKLDLAIRDDRSGTSTHLSASVARELKIAEAALKQAKRLMASSDHVDRAATSAGPESAFRRSAGNRTTRRRTLTNGGEGVTQQRAVVEKSALRYDGKSFGQWRDQWRTELNPERRTEAIQAFSTFAKNGYAREAAEEIVTIMHNYDSYMYDASPTGKLKQAAIEALASIDVKVRDPMLVDGLKSSNHNAMIFALQVLGQHGFDPNTFLPVFRQMIENKKNDRQVRGFAIAVLSGDRTAEEVKQILIGAIGDDDPVIVQAAIRAMVPRQPRSPAGFSSPTADENPIIRGSDTYLPYLVDALLRNSDSVVRKAAALALGRLGPDAKAAVPTLVKALHEEKKNEQRAVIIRALGEIGAAAKEAVPLLVELWNDNQRQVPEQEKLRQAILTTLQRIAPADEEVRKLLNASRGNRR